MSGLSSGGVLAAWLSAYAKPGQVVAALYEDPPLFASEIRPAIGPGIRQCIGPLFDLWSTFLGDQWSIGAWDAMRKGSADRLPEHLRFIPVPDEPPQNLKEYDPEWARSFWTGTVGVSCDHERMLRSVKVPAVLLTHHIRITDEASGFLFGAMSDQQAHQAQSFPHWRGRQVEVPIVPYAGHRCTAETRALRSDPVRLGHEYPGGARLAPSTHAHYPGELPAALDTGHAQPDGFPPAWSRGEDEHVADGPARNRDVTASISSPGVHLADERAARDLAREVNEAGRRAVVDHPGRFGLFASLPLPDVDAAIAEIAHCCDRLDVAGFTLLTNIGGTYLGDPAFQPVFRELDRRGARLFIHPTSPACWEHTSLGRPRPMLEFFFDTTRAVVDLVLNGTVARHPGVEFIIPHAGATLPMVADQVSVFSRCSASTLGGRARDLGRLHFDLAGFPASPPARRAPHAQQIEHLHWERLPFT